jgi:glycerol-3-phosphate cytidylyltransferase-like family protein
LFGGRVRAEALETLAGTSKPLSAYHVAKVIEAQPIQVLTVLKALEPDIVHHSHDGWILSNEILRQFLRDELSSREAARRSEKDEILGRHSLKPRSKDG